MRTLYWTVPRTVTVTVAGSGGGDEKEVER